MRNPEREKAIKRAVAERLRANPDWLNKERERRRKRHKARRKDREFRRNHAGVGGCANVNKRRRTRRTMGKRSFFVGHAVVDFFLRRRHDRGHYREAASYSALNCAAAKRDDGMTAATLERVCILSGVKFQ